MGKALDEKLEAEGWLAPAAVSHSAGVKPFGSAFASYEKAPARRPPPRVVKVKPSTVPAVHYAGFTFNMGERRWCFYCGLTLGNLVTRDHVVPTSKGGVNHRRNIVFCCDWCNSLKGNMSVNEFRVFVLNNNRKAVAKGGNSVRMIAACEVLGLYLRK